ncbi:hypothetical protein C8R44DRAFT_862337 [Mycena epipterygia]|nr:hypothetical protein C8R44DRAFT_862337 [Mycena epipterygia]
MSRAARVREPGGKRMDGIVDELLGQGGVCASMGRTSTTRWRWSISALGFSSTRRVSGEQGRGEGAQGGRKDTLDRGVQRMCEPAKGADKEPAAVRLHPRPHRHAARVQDGLSGFSIEWFVCYEGPCP